MAVACPACMSSDLAQGCAAYVTSVLHGTDVVPTFSPYSSDDLRHEVLRSSWFAQWRRDASGRIMRCVQGARRYGHGASLVLALAAVLALVIVIALALVIVVALALVIVIALVLVLVLALVIALALVPGL